MNKNIFIKFLLLALPALMLTSCLKDQEDIFPDSASARVSKYLDNTKRVLTSAENGWVLNYFPDRNQSYGGYSYTMSFDEDNAKIYCELADDVLEPITTTYTLKNEDGPVLMFDTYNEYMHYFATPTGSSGAGGYEAYDGDFIFIIMNISEDEKTITLKGNRSGNILYMHKLEGQTPESYQSVMKEYKDNLVFDKAAGTIDGANSMLYINAAKRNIRIQTPDTTVSAPFCFLSDGLTLYQPIHVAGKEVSSFAYNEDKGTFTIVGTDVVYTGLLIPDIVINNVGSTITTGNAETSFTYTFNLADQFKYTPDVDWITVSVNGKQLTVNIAANTTGNPRNGNIIVEANGEKATINVSQMEVTDLLGNYVMTGVDSDDAEVAYRATVSQAGSDYALTFYYPNSNYPQTIMMKWNEDETRFEMQSGQTLGSLGRYPYSFLCFIDDVFEYWTNTSKAVTGYIIPSLDADGKVVLSLGGTFGSSAIGGLCILVGNDSAIENRLGWYEAFTQIAFTKQ